MHLTPEPTLTLLKVEYVQLISPLLTGVPSVEYQFVSVLHGTAADLLLRCRIGGAGRLHVVAEVLGGSHLEQVVVECEGVGGTGRTSEGVAGLPVTRDRHGVQPIRYVDAMQDLWVFPRQ